MILGETALSFLGLGLRPPITSWGVLLNEAQNINVVALYPWLMLPRGAGVRRSCWRSTSSATACATPPTPTSSAAPDLDVESPQGGEHEDRVADLRSRWTPEATAAAIAFLESRPTGYELPTMEQGGATYLDLRGLRIEQARRSTRRCCATSTCAGRCSATSASRTRASSTATSAR